MKSAQKTAGEWAAFIDEMQGIAPTRDVDEASRQLLAVAFCNPQWLLSEAEESGAGLAVWEVLTRDQWAGLLAWAQRRQAKKALH